jgi:hypothetical protein
VTYPGSFESNGSVDNRILMAGTSTFTFSLERRQKRLSTQSMFVPEKYATRIMIHAAKVK